MFGANLEFFYGSNDTAWGIGAIGFIDQAESQLSVSLSPLAIGTTGVSPPGGGDGPISLFANQPLILANNGVSQFTTGTGTLQIIIWYTVTQLQ